MTLVRRKRKIHRILADVAIAPFAFIVVGVVTGLPMLGLIAVLMLVSMWLSGEPFANLANLVPTAETGIMVVVIFGFVAFAAVPLAIRDHLSSGGYEVIWKPTEGCIAVAEEYVESWRSGHIESLRRNFSEHLGSQMTAADLAQEFELLTHELGKPVSVESVEEQEIYCSFPETSVCDQQVDCVVKSVLRHANGRSSTVVFELNSRDEFRIEEFLLPDFECC
ncbi:MAG: hypothetical protein ACPGLY_11525 [Rubripirellula sp.]